MTIEKISVRELRIGIYCLGEYLGSKLTPKEVEICKDYICGICSYQTLVFHIENEKLRFELANMNMQSRDVNIYKAMILHEKNTRKKISIMDLIKEVNHA